MKKRFISFIMTISMLFSLITTAFASTPTTRDIEFFEINGQTFCQISEDDMVSLLWETEDSSIFAAISNVNIPLEVSQLIVPANVISNNNSSSWEAAYEYGTQAFPSVLELEDVMRSSLEELVKMQLIP